MTRKSGPHQIGEADDTLPAIGPPAHDEDDGPNAKRPPTVGGRGMRVSRRALRQAFASKLPELVGSICQHWNACVDAPNEEPKLKELVAAVESLARAARTFRQPEVSAAAARIEAYLQAIVTDERLPKPAEGTKIAEMIADLVEVVETMPDAVTVIDAEAIDLGDLQEQLGTKDPTTDRTPAAPSKRR